MEYGNLGGSGLKVPVLMLGTATFGGGSDFFRKWGTTDVAAADLQLSADQIARLDAASAVRPAYPYWHQRRTSLARNPPPVG